MSGFGSSGMANRARAVNMGTSPVLFCCTGLVPMLTALRK